MTPSQSTYTGSPSQVIEKHHHQQQQETPQVRPPSKNTQFEDSLLSTPRNPPPTKPQIAGFSSPYESLKRELRGSSPPMQDSEFPSTPRNPGSSPMKAVSSTRPRSTTRRKAKSQKTPSTATNKDVMLHRVLDKNYRLAATPLTTTTTKSRRQQPPLSGNRALPHRSTVSSAETPSASSTTTRNRKPPPSQKSHLFDSSPAAPPAPTLNADLFKSPGPVAPSRRYIGSGVGGGRVPGTSILSSAKKKKKGGRGMTPRRQQQQQQQQSTPVTHAANGEGQKEGLSEAEKRRLDEWDDDDDDDGGGGLGDVDDDEDTDGDILQGMSPPKTIQFHVPQSRLLQTPGQSSSFPPFLTLLKVLPLPSSPSLLILPPTMTHLLHSLSIFSTSLSLVLAPLLTMPCLPCSYSTRSLQTHSRGPAPHRRRRRPRSREHWWRKRPDDDDEEEGRRRKRRLRRG